MLITDGIHEKNVTKGAYNQFYKPLGYKPIVIIENEEIEKPKEVEVVVDVQPTKIEKKEKTVLKTKTPKKSKK